MSRLSKHFVFAFLNIGGRLTAQSGNYTYLLERVSGLEGVHPVFPELPCGVAPWVLPLTLGDTPNLHRVLRALGIPAVTWGGVRHPRILANEFPGADFLYEYLVFLPIHQDLDRTHLDVIADAVAAVRTWTKEKSLSVKEARIVGKKWCSTTQWRTALSDWLYRPPEQAAWPSDSTIRYHNLSACDIGRSPPLSGVHSMGTRLPRLKEGLEEERNYH